MQIEVEKTLYSATVTEVLNVATTVFKDEDEGDNESMSNVANKREVKQNRTAEKANARFKRAKKAREALQLPTAAKCGDSSNGTRTSKT